MAKRRDDEFVVGNGRAGAAVFGNAWFGARPLTAEEALGLRQGPQQKQTIYRLVPVTVAEVERQAARERRARKGRR